MAGGVKNLDIEIPEFQLLVVLHIRIRLSRWNGEWKLKHAGLDGGLKKLWFVETVDEDFGVGEFSCDNSMISGVIEVAVGEPQADQIESAFFNVRQKGRGCVVRRIENR